MAVAHSSATTTTALGGTTDRPGDPPALPVRDAAFKVANAAARDGHLEDLGGVGHGQVAEPLGERGPTRGHGELGLERAAKRTPFGVREPNERPLKPRVRHGRTSEVGHDFLISESRAALKTPQAVHRFVSLPPDPPQPTTDPTGGDEHRTAEPPSLRLRLRSRISQPDCPPNRIRSTRGFLGRGARVCPPITHAARGRARARRTKSWSCWRICQVAYKDKDEEGT